VAGLRWRIADGPQVLHIEDQGAAPEHRDSPRGPRRVPAGGPAPAPVRAGSLGEAETGRRSQSDLDEEIARGLQAELWQLRQLRDGTAAAGTPAAAQGAAAGSGLHRQLESAVAPGRPTGAGGSCGDAPSSAPRQEGRRPHPKHNRAANSSPFPQEMQLDHTSSDPRVQPVELRAAGPGLAEPWRTANSAEEEECASLGSPSTSSSTSTATGRRRAKRKVWKRPPVPMDKVLEADDAAAMLRCMPEVP